MGSEFQEGEIIGADFEGELRGIIFIWGQAVDDDGIFYGTGNVSGTEFTFKLYPGTETQPVCETISDDLGTDTPRYPRLCYAVFTDFPLESFGNTLQATNFKFELIKLPQEFTPIEEEV